MSTKINNSTNPHPTQPYFLPRRVIPLTAFTRRPAWQRLALALYYLLTLPVRVVWSALYLAGKERAAKEAETR